MFKKSFNLVQKSLTSLDKQTIYRYVSTNAYKNNKLSQKSLHYNTYRFFSSILNTQNFL